ncbi:MAG: DNA-binding response regulator [Idiomarina sp.]|uniref:response regulator transcription factor n=1 Tax=Idiomarina sp. TaxID=1874361 RepID=UPI000C109013|nr:response regulator transcription factor [Idiomarina sp.]MBL4741953.1 response regulator transcription factor [Idiomarina sp.]MBT41351.1 DNA-binding response regulator [Idiomarina sp.]PHQ77428.1 MAG: DNA-binding response regulator [Idiomarina sp.]
MINILLVDDQTLVRQGLKSLLDMSERVAVVAEAENGNSAIAAVSQYRPDVVLMDIRMPEMDGIEAVSQLSKEFPSVAVLMLTTFDDHASVIAAIQAGAKGYLLKDVSLETLVDAIEALYRGESWIQPVVTERIIKGLQSVRPQTPTTDLVEPLTDKELAVLRLVAAGLSNQEIAESLFKSTGTVKNQVSSLMAKLEVRDRTRAVLKAIELGLL